MKTLNDLFILEGMKECDVLAGHRGLNRNVQFVNISDTPDVIHFLDEHHLLLSTCYAFQNDPQKMCDLIQQMHDMNCSGLIIKVNRFLKQLPEEVKLLADDLAFPIIDLPTARTLGDLSRHILNYLNDHESEQLYYALHVQKEFSDMMLKEYTTNALVEHLGHFLVRPTLLLNHRGETIAKSHHFRPKEMLELQEKMIGMIQSNLSAARAGQTFTFKEDEHPPFTTFPIQTKRRYSSILVILDSLTLPYPSSQMAIEQAGNVISFTLIKEQAINENARLLKNNFFADLIEKRIHSEEEIISRANYYGLQENLHSVCMICTVDKDTKSYETLQLYEKKIGELHNYIYDQLEDEIAHSNISATLFTKETYFVMILQFPRYTDKEIALVENFAKTIQTNMDQTHTISFGISYPFHPLSNMSSAYHEAAEAISYGQNMHMKEFIYFYKAKEIKELLATIPKQDLKALYSSTLKDLAYPKTKEDQELLKTVEVYLNCQCEISEASRKLYVHRNTVKYRIKKVEELLNCTLHDPVNSLRIRVALVIGNILSDEQHEEETIV
ncbi:Purine catabolism regulatory protein [Lentibacillus sp. JNUCC-1]|uniref:PucR family transcriptional regulator n=1 Tax=Lentibacillus sp. JNUCC-1 TaxID=2654513 RepID=UPI0013261F7C|nr:PucR family transcriptional regulator [Lentibacillus sp. JNUCC-1]MUV38283.1 Purine catabolism regulatory protein [Lentibacillus sp. JNUCC-1]